MEYVLQTKNLSKAYRKSKALDSLNLNVPKGAVYGLVGKNGAGKTTLIRLVCGLQKPTGGALTLFGTDGSSREILKARRRIGAVVETPSVCLDMSAEDNLKHQLKMLGSPDYTEIPELLKTVGLENAGKKKARHFSLGMRQRLGIAVAMAGNPDFLILDEPANGLDPQGIIEIRELILKLNREMGVTVLISSHILDELSRIATHYGFIDRGSTVKEISAEELNKACRKCIRVKVSDMNVLVRILENAGIEYSVGDGGFCDIYGEINITWLTLSLNKENCDVLSVFERDESLENYFINLVGGFGNE